MAGTTYVWNSATSGDWWDTTHWNPVGGFPYTDDTADLSVGGAAFTVTMEDGTITTTGGGSTTITGYAVGFIKLGTNGTLHAETSQLDIQTGAANSGKIIADYSLQVGYTTANAVVSITSLTSAMGHIVLNGATGATLSGHAAGIELDLHGQSLEGSGTVQNLKLKVFDDSRINANASGQTLALATGDDILNNGLIEATGGGVLTISSAAIRQGAFASGNLAGVINASDANSKVYLASDTIYGGAITNSGGGTVTFNDSNNLIDGSTSVGAVAISGVLEGGGYNFTLKGEIQNQGVIDVRSATLFVDSTIGVTLNSGGASTHGDVKLSGGYINSASNVANGAFFDNIDNTIQGYGAIVNLSMVNEATGTINANVSGQTLSIDGSDHFIDYGVLEASNGGILSYTSQGIDPTLGGKFVTDATSTIQIASDTFYSGSYNANFTFVDSNNIFDGSIKSGTTFAVNLDTGGYNVTWKGAIHNKARFTPRSATLIIDSYGVTLDSGGATTKGSIVLAGGYINSSLNTARGSAFDNVDNQNSRQRRTRQSEADQRGRRRHQRQCEWPDAVDRRLRPVRQQRADRGDQWRRPQRLEPNFGLSDRRAHHGGRRLHGRHRQRYFQRRPVRGRGRRRLHVL